MKYVRTFLFLMSLVILFVMNLALHETIEHQKRHISYLEEYIAENNLPTPAMRHGITLGPGESITLEFPVENRLNE